MSAGGPVGPGGLVPVPTYRDQPATPVTDIAGVDPTGQDLSVSLAGTGHWVLLLFLSTTCGGCADFWRAVGDPQPLGLVTDEGLWAVTRAPGNEDPAAVSALTAGRVLMSDGAWVSYRVHGPPFFVLVDGVAPRVVTEGVAWGLEQVAGHVRRARAGNGRPEVPNLDRPGPSARPDGGI